LLKNIRYEELLSENTSSCKTEKSILDIYTGEFFHYPQSYLALKSTPIGPFDGNKNIDKVAEDVRTYTNDTNEAFDLLYKGIYEKVTAYQKIYSEALLPFVNPTDFASSKGFISPKDLDIPLLKQIPLW
jgi:hypothetical protein